MALVRGRLKAAEKFAQTGKRVGLREIEVGIHKACLKSRPKAGRL
jgi:hypothetical protein